jgi:hypothetical protein
VFYGSGGGGGGVYLTTPYGLAGGITSGGGNGGGNGTGFTPASTGFVNTGSGGGGGICTTASGAEQTGGAGGSGIVVIRYPAYLAPATAVGANTYISGPYRVYVWVSSGSITF